MPAYKHGHHRNSCLDAEMDGGMEGHVLGTLCHQPHPLCADFILKLIKVMKNESKYIR